MRGATGPRLYRSSAGRLKLAREAWALAEPPRWVQEAHAHLRAKLLNPGETFPCDYGTRAALEGCLRYTFVEREEAPYPAALADALGLYLATYRAIGRRSALVVYAGPPEPEWSLVNYEARFWRVLQGLHACDPRPWPASVPHDSEQPGWEFCFAGEPLFVSGHSPLHVHRRNRLAKGGLMLVMEPRHVLAGVAGHGRVPEAARGIRKVPERCDDVPPALAASDPRRREWQRYWRSDSDELRPERCPLRISAARKAPSGRKDVKVERDNVAADRKSSRK